MTWEPSGHGLAALRFLWNQYKDSISFEPTSEEAWVDEFFFCLLGGYGIRFELNLSAFHILRDHGMFEPHWYCSPQSGVEQLVRKELQTPQFAPAKKNGELRKYRFHNQKTKVIVQAGRWLYRRCHFRIQELLDGEAYLNRRKLLDCPGFGYKTASWFLRNIGKGHSLAIVDVHLYRVLTDFAIIPRSLSIEQDYAEIEEIFNRACRSIEAAPDLMDLILWNWERGGGIRIHGNGSAI